MSPSSDRIDPRLLVHQAFGERASREPWRVAATCGGLAITYGELRERSGALARHLRALGVGPDVLVALCLPRSLDLLVGILGVLEAGGAYLPIEPGTPPGRIEALLRDAGARIAVADAARAPALAAGGARVVRLDADAGEIARAPAAPGAAPDPAHLAYVIYTSGSTGQPKGVMVTHGNLARLFEAARPWMRFDEGDVWTMLHSYAFDFSVWEIWGALLHGGRLVIPPPEVTRSAEGLLELIEREGVTVLNVTPSAFRQLVRADQASVDAPHVPHAPRAPSLRLVIFGGEAVDLEDVARFRARRGDGAPLLVNMYGITETTVHVTCRPLRRDDEERPWPTPIGAPLADLTVRLLDERAMPAQDGEAGEIYVGGAGVARGYLHRPALTAARFVPDPEGPPGARMYRSGDRARRSPGGELGYLGRADDQVKIRGYRIEPGEVEAALSTHPGVLRCAVVAREDTPGDRRLCAYVAPRPGAAGGLLEWRRFLAERLPEHMVPAELVTIPELPLSPNGKLDRRALPAPGPWRPALAEAYVAPRTPLEATIAGVWAEVLRREPIGVHDRFFDLGGDSLLGMQVLSRLRAALGAAIPVRTLFDAPTVAELAEHVAASGSGGPAAADAPIARREGGAAPLSPAQERLWFLHQLDPRSAAYHLAFALRLEGPLDPGALERSLAAILERHEALRTAIAGGAAGPAQRAFPAQPLPLPCDDLTLEPVTAREACVAALARELAAPPFDLALAPARGPLLRARLVRLGPEEHALLLAVHHIAFDGWSMGVLLRELAALYEASCAGRAPPLPPLPLQYGEYALEARRALESPAFAAQLERRRRELLGAPPVLHLPADRPRPPAPTYRAGYRALRIDPGLTASLKALARGEGATLFMTLLAALGALLGAWAGEDDLVLGAPTAGRVRPELEGLIGFFASTLPIRLSLDGDPSFLELLSRTRTRTLAAYADQEVPFERLVQELAPERDPRYHPLFQVAFALQAAPDEIEAAGLRLRLSELETGATPFDLTFQLWEIGGRVEGTVAYAADLFEDATIARLLEAYAALLARIAAAPSRRVSALCAPLAPLAPDPRERAACEAAERALLADPAVDDCAVRLRRTAALEPVLVAYVVPAPPPSPRLPELPPLCFVTLSALPLTDDGRIDEAALRRVPVVDEELARRCEELLRRQDGVEDAAVFVHEGADRLQALHLADLLPGWAGALESEAGATPDAAPQAAPAEAADGPPAYMHGGPLRLDEGAPRTLIAALLRTSAIHGDKGITTAEGELVAFTSYAALVLAARRALSGLRRHGIRPGDRVVLQLGALRDHFIAFWACLLGGVVPVTVAVPPSYDAPNGVTRKLHAAFQLLGGPAVLTSRRLVEPLLGLRAIHPLDGLRALAIEDLLEDPPAEHLHEPRPEDVAFLQLSSGSTGTPKCVQETHRGVVHHVHGAQAKNAYREDDVTVNWLPLDHVGAMLMFHVKDTYLGCSQVHLRTEDVIADPLRWLDRIEAHRATHTWSPNFGYKLLSDAIAAAPGRRWDLSSMRFFMNAGEQVTLPVARELLGRLAPFGVRAAAMQPAFGMAETCTAITYQNRFDPVATVHHVLKASLRGRLETAAREGPDAITFVDVGEPMPGVELRILDAGGAVVPERVIGRLQVRGAVTTPGYLDNPEANREALAEDGWFETGDLGFLSGGSLTLTGRAKETIIVRGANFYCHEIEEAVGRVAGVEPTFAAACAAADPRRGTEGLAVFFVPAEGSPDARARIAAAIRAEITASLGIAPAAVIPVEKEAFPRTTSGKIQRGELGRRLAEGRFREVLKDIDRRLEAPSTIPDWFFRRTWRRREVAAELPEHGGLTVVLLDGAGLGAALCARLAAAGEACLAVEPGDRFERLAEDRLRIDPRDPEHYRRLLEIAPGPVDRVAHLLTWGELAPALSGPDELTSLLDAGLRSALFLVQALAKRPDAGRPVRLLLVSSEAQPVAAGEAIAWGKAPLLGLVQTAPRELPWLDCRHVDLPAGPPDAAAVAVARELSAAPREREVAYRGGQRWVMRIERADLAARDAPPTALPFEQGGLYLITGGLGGLGPEIGRYLLEEHGARLLVIGRTPLPAARASAEPGAPERLRALRSLQDAAARAGAAERVVYEAADVADPGALHAAVERAEARFGAPLAGVLHLAGVLEERTLADETPEGLDAALRPRAQGAAALRRLLGARPRAILVGFSSLNGTLGGFSAGAYAAACRALEHAIHDLRRERGGRCWSFAWSQWDGPGMGARYASDQRLRALGYLKIPPAKGLRALLAGLSHPPGDLLIGLDGAHFEVLRRAAGPVVTRERLSAFIAGARADAADPAGAAPALRDRFGAPAAYRLERLPRLPRSAGGAVDAGALLGLQGARAAAGPAYAAPEDEAARTVASIWQEALGVDRVGADDNFFDLGGHSLLLAQVRGRIERAFGREVPVVELFRHPTVRALSAYLRGPAPRAPEGVEARALRQRAALERRRQRSPVKGGSDR